MAKPPIMKCALGRKSTGAAIAGVVVPYLASDDVLVLKKSTTPAAFALIGRL
jgi:hypothetical protein